MQDYVASFYGGYEVGTHRHLARRAVPWAVLAVAVALLALGALVASDVSAVEARPALVQVTVVNWYAAGSLLTTSSGFSLRASTTAFFPLTCASLCLPWNGATVSEPFSLVAFSVAYRGLQYTNVTVRAPATGYAGPLTIALDLP